MTYYPKSGEWVVYANPRTSETSVAQVIHVHGSTAAASAGTTIAAYEMSDFPSRFVYAHEILGPVPAPPLPVPRFRAPVAPEIDDEHYKHWEGDGCTAQHYEANPNIGSQYLACGQDFMAGTICSLPAAHPGAHAAWCPNCGGDWVAGCECV